MRLKRAFDVLFSLVVLAVLLPLLLALAVWIKLDSRGPVIFRQERVGRFGRPFEILKFRTMHYTAVPGELQITGRRDRRITRVGGILRRYKLDELPQFLNVLYGEMSVVGPRPEVPRYVELYPASAREIVLSVRPGITDPASLSFRDESELLDVSIDPEQTYVEQIMPEKVALAQQYVARRTFFGDLKIILKTALACLGSSRGNA